MIYKICSLFKGLSIITSLLILTIVYFNPINYKIVIWVIINFLIIVGFILDLMLPESFTDRIKKSKKLIDLHNKLLLTNNSWYLNLFIVILPVSSILVKVIISIWLI